MNCIIKKIVLQEQFDLPQIIYAFLNLSLFPVYCNDFTFAHLRTKITFDALIKGNG